MKQGPRGKNRVSGQRETNVFQALNWSEQAKLLRAKQKDERRLGSWGGASTRPFPLSFCSTLRVPSSPPNELRALNRPAQNLISEFQSGALTIRQRCFLIIGSLSKDYGNGNEDARKQ